jgi:predicted nucleic acid-binding protein
VPVFADTNVVVYAFAKDDAKVAIAEGILKKQPIISVQVLSEFLNVSRDKLGLDITSRHKLATELIAGCNVVSLDAVLVEKARQIEVQAQFSYWDALIVAAALLSGCDTLYTEDLQDGRVCFIVAIVAILVVAGSSHVVHPRSPARRQL